MIYDTFCKKIKKYISLQFFTILILFAFTSCRSTNEAEVRFFDQNTNPYVPLIDKNSLIMDSYIDINPFQEEGLAWAPFILPNENWLSVLPSDSLVGYWNGANNPILPPEPGNCRILDDTEISNLPKGELKRVQFESDNLFPHHDFKKLFFLMSSESKKPFAIVKMNAEGKASCFIALKKYVISTGYGDLRREFQVDSETTNVKVPFFDSSYVKIIPKGINGIKNGDILRLGRTLSEENLKKIEENFQSGSMLIPSRIAKDLFVVGNIQTKRMNVDEYQKTSILIGEKPFELQLEPALYTFAVLRKNKLVCLKSIELSDNEIFELNCEGEDKYFLDSEQDNNSYIFDNSIFPIQMMESNVFLNWLFAGSKILLANFYNVNLDFEIKNDSEQEVNKKLNFIAQNYDKKYVSFSNNFFINQLNSMNEMNRFDFNKIYIGVSGKMLSPNVSFLRNDSQNLPFLGIPLGGTGEKNLAHNAVPFSAFTKINRLIYKPEFLKFSNIQASNGATFSIFEPLTLLDNDSMFSSYVQQKFRLRILIPEWNSTNVVEMYVNGKLRRRWVLDRGDLSKPFSAGFEENIMETKAFTVRWLAWGDEYLPDFLVGTHNSIPFAITRDFCVDYSGDGICHVEQ